MKKLLSITIAGLLLTGCAITDESRCDEIYDDLKVELKQINSLKQEQAMLEAMIIDLEDSYNEMDTDILVKLFAIDLCKDTNEESDCDYLQTEYEDMIIESNDIVDEHDFLMGHYTRVEETLEYTNNIYMDYKSQHIEACK